MTTESKTSKRRLAAIERQAQALELRKAGVSFPKIAEALGYCGPGSAYSAVHAAIQRVLREPVEELVNIELARLDEMLFALWPAIRRGDPQAIDRGLRIMERRAKYLGLDAPAKVRVDIYEEVRRMAEAAGIDADEAVREAERIARAAQNR